MKHFSAFICRQEGDKYVAVGRHSQIRVPTKKIKDMKLGQFVEFEEAHGKWQLAAGMKNRIAKGKISSAAGKVIDDEFHIQMPVDFTYDSFHRLWRGFTRDLGNIYVPKHFNWPLKEKVKKLNQEIWRELCLIRRLHEPIDTLHMGKVDWAVSQVISEPMPVVTKKEKKKVENVHELDQIYPGERVAVVIGMAEKYEGNFIAFVFDVTGDSILRIEDVTEINIGDWIAFKNPDEIKNYRHIEAVLPSKRFRNTVMIKLDGIDVPASIEVDKVYAHPVLGVISNANDILLPGKDLTAVVEKIRPTKKNPYHWVVTQLIVPPTLMCDVQYANALLIAFSNSVGPRAYHVNKELLACRSPFFAEKFSKLVENGKYDVYGEPKAVGRVLEILFYADLRDAKFVEHDAPILEFWNGLLHIREILYQWQLRDLLKFVIEKILLYHCEDPQCHHCVNRTAFAHIHRYPYPSRRNWNPATVAMWSQEWLGELKKTLPKMAGRLQDFADYVP